MGKNGMKWLKSEQCSGLRKVHRKQSDCTDSLENCGPLEEKRNPPGDRREAGFVGSDSKWVVDSVGVGRRWVNALRPSIGGSAFAESDVVSEVRQ